MNFLIFTIASIVLWGFSLVMASITYALIQEDGPSLYQYLINLIFVVFSIITPVIYFVVCLIKVI